MDKPTTTTMDDGDRKAPPQAAQAPPDEDSKPPAKPMPDDNPSKKRKTGEGGAPTASEEEVVDVAAQTKKPMDKPTTTAMDDGDRKSPPEALPKEKSNPPAKPATDGNPSKRRKTDKEGGASASAAREEVVDVAAELNFQPGERIEVKWTINDDEEEEEGGQKESEAKPKADNDDHSGKSIMVWWGATLCGRTNKMHTLTEEEREESEGATNLYKSPDVQLPIYTLNYAPLEEYGFQSHSLEEVAFISKQTLLNLSTDEIMIFRKHGEPSPPSSPSKSQAVQDTSSITKEFSGQEEIRSFMNQLMQQCLKSTGMDKKMKSLPASAQLDMAERITKAKQGMLDKMMEETDKMGAGNKVITADVVRKCMSQMKGGY